MYLKVLKKIKFYWLASHIEEPFGVGTIIGDMCQREFDNLRYVSQSLNQ